MTIKEISIFTVWTIQSLLLLGVYCDACIPCEENTNCDIAYTTEYDIDVPSSLIWRSDGVDVCTCETTDDTECLIYPQFQQEIKASIQLDAGTVTSIITVLNATRASGWTGSKWELFAYSNEETLVLMNTCDLKIYKKINNATCDYKATQSGLNITCISTNVYPESACDFSVKIDNIYQHYELSPVYNNTVVKQHPVYYKSICTMDIAKEKIKPGLWEIDTTIFPDVYKNGTNCELCNSGQLFRFNLTIEKPAVSFLNCSKVVDEGDEIVCICQREDKSDIQTFVYWESGGTENFTRYAILKAKAWKNNTEITNAIAFSNNTTHIILITVIVCGAILIVFGIWLIWFFKRSQKPRQSSGSKKMLTVADEVWYNDADPETQNLLEDDELSSQNEWNQCKKPQGHDGLILCSDFMKNPKKYFKILRLKYDEGFNDYITASIKLTVRIVVNYVSSDRTARYKTLYKHRGTKYTFTGSGVVVGAKVDGKVYISTATHVVFDHTEAENTTAELFYHDQDRRRQEVKKLKGVRLEKRSIYGESCLLECVTSDLILCQDLISFLGVKRKLFKAVPIYPNKIMVISHPHGMPKYISFGTCSQVETKSETIFSLSSLKYTATTCPGSSGGPVFILNDNFRERFNTNIVGDYPLHSGANSGGLNYSGVAHKPTLSITNVLYNSQAQIDQILFRALKIHILATIQGGKQFENWDSYQMCLS